MKLHKYSITELLLECRKPIEEADDEVLHDEYIRVSQLIKLLEE